MTFANESSSSFKFKGVAINDFDNLLLPPIWMKSLLKSLYY